MPTLLNKSEAHRLVDILPETATWEDLVKEIYVRETLELALEQSDTGKTISHQDMLKRYGLA